MSDEKPTVSESRKQLRAKIIAVFHEPADPDVFKKNPGLNHLRGRNLDNLDVALRKAAYCAATGTTYRTHATLELLLAYVAGRVASSYHLDDDEDRPLPPEVEALLQSPHVQQLIRETEEKEQTP